MVLLIKSLSINQQLMLRNRILGAKAVQNQNAASSIHKSLQKKSGPFEKTKSSWKSLPLRQDVRNTILTSIQKESLSYLVSILNVILNHKLIISQDKLLIEEVIENAEPHFFEVPERDSNACIHSFLTDLVLKSGVCQPGREEEFLNTLMDISSSIQEEDQLEIESEDAFEFTEASKELFEEFDIPPHSETLKQIALLLAGLKNNPPVSYELKKLMQQKLKETEKDEKLEESEFDYMEISRVDN